MKKLLLVSVLSTFIFLLISCTSTPVQEETVPVAESPVGSAVTEPQPEIAEDDEYSKAISEMADNSLISKDTFEEDKKIILTIIEQLSGVMDKRDYSKWCTFIEPSSLTYWKNPANLKKASSRLPVKGINLNNLEDYFTYVFIPSRKGHVVDQIRYINDKSVKAVQVSADNTLVVYYNFVQVNNKWMIHLPVIN